MNQSIETTAAAFARARAEGRPLGAFPGVLPPDLPWAYRCQQAAMSLWPDALAGWKVARIAPSWHARYAEERLIGPVFARNVHRPAPGQSVECPAFADGFAAVEAEIGIIVGTDAAAGRMDWNPRTAVELVGSMCIGVEVASSPLATLNDLGPGAVIADFGNNWGVLLGTEFADWSSREAAISVTTWIDDALVGQGSVSLQAVPLQALAFAANKAAGQGRPLRAGAYISTGMITGVHDIRIGQRARVGFEGCGDLRCQMVAAKALSWASSETKAGAAR